MSGQVVIMAAQNNLRSIRTNEGLTITDLARLSKVSTKTISRLEEGSRNVAPATKAKVIKGLNKVSDKLKEYTLEDVFPRDSRRASKKRGAS
jgi:transcriptional regulator with XRE-family HTH domain